MLGDGNQSIAMLICEATTEPTKPEILKGSNINRAVVKTTLQTMGNINRNKRIYDPESLIKGLNAPHIQELIERKSWVGEAGHPLNSTLERQSNIDNNNISHRINSWSQEGSVIKGIIEGLDGGEGSPGRKFNNFILQEMETAYSLRALGSVQKTPQGNLVKGHIHVVTYDWVILPSHKEAYQEEILKMSESLKVNNNQLITEGFMIPINQNQAIDFIKESSKNLKYVSEFLELELDHMVLSENMKSVTIKGNDVSARVRLEEHVTKSLVNSYLSRL